MNNSGDIGEQSRENRKSRYGKGKARSATAGSSTTNEEKKADGNLEPEEVVEQSEGYCR